MKEYTAWRRFLAWYGLITLIASPFFLAWLVGFSKLVNQCLAQ